MSVWVVFVGVGVCYLSIYLSISVMLYTHCTHSIPPLQVQLYQAKDQADMFQGSYQSLVAGLGGVQEAQEKQEPIHSEVEVVKQQLEAHKVGYIANCHSIPLSQFHVTLVSIPCHFLSQFCTSSIQCTAFVQYKNQSKHQGRSMSNQRKKNPYPHRFERKLVLTQCQLRH